MGQGVFGSEFQRIKGLVDWIHSRNIIMKVQGRTELLNSWWPGNKAREQYQTERKRVRNGTYTPRAHFHDPPGHTQKYALLIS